MSQENRGFFAYLISQKWRANQWKKNTGWCFFYSIIENFMQKFRCFWGHKKHSKSSLSMVLRSREPEDQCYWNINYWKKLFLVGQTFKHRCTSKVNFLVHVFNYYNITKAKHMLWLVNLSSIICPWLHTADVWV